MGKWKCGICNSEFNNYQAQGFNGTIYCPLCYFKELYKREKTKNDKAIEYLKTFHFIDDIRVLDIKEFEKLLEILEAKNE